MNMADTYASPEQVSDMAPWVDFSQFNNSSYDPGRGFFVRMLWYFVSLMVFESGFFPVYRLKQWILKAFGAKVGAMLVIKPHVRIKYPWRLVAGDYCSIGQDVWIDNLDNVDLGNHVCISQKAYLCTGSHDYRKRTFDLITRPITVGSGAWIGAASLLLGGVSVGPNAVVAAGSVVARSVPPAAIVAGNPARSLGRERQPPN